MITNFISPTIIPITAGPSHSQPRRNVANMSPSSSPLLSLQGGIARSRCIATLVQFGGAFRAL